MTRPALETTADRERADLAFNEAEERYCTLAEGDALVHAGERVTWLRRIRARANHDSKGRE